MQCVCSVVAQSQDVVEGYHSLPITITFQICIELGIWRLISRTISEGPASPSNVVPRIDSSCLNSFVSSVLDVSDNRTGAGARV